MPFLYTFLFLLLRLLNGTNRTMYEQEAKMMNMRRSTGRKKRKFTNPSHSLSLSLVRSLAHRFLFVIRKCETTLGVYFSSLALNRKCLIKYWKSVCVLTLLLAYSLAIICLVWFIVGFLFSIASITIAYMPLQNKNKKTRRSIDK
jgi:uncharacterized integral membrane protein